ncbi:hypothetical protein [Nonomuraea lactucae]|uniref:hypothetical protein n=1 Tax=Nonomuraea lactucae TaxID=2249762 RepID=UPI000DE40977|nr:hypothetical protein [Nonomuraea lactucae]
MVVGLAFVGAFGYWVFNVVVAIVVLSMESSVAIGVGAVILALAALGGGIVLLVLRRSWALGLGLGLLIGWALASIVTAGYCTGLNPGMYA